MGVLPVMKLRMLRIFLGLSAITWLAALPGVFLGWNVAASIMEGFGSNPFEYDEMLDYWLRMACGAFGIIGCLYLLPAIKPKKFQAFIPVLGTLAVAEGVVLLAHGLRLKLAPWPFYGDVAACLVSGCGILWSWRVARDDLQ
jgi:hypothetical protein